MPLQTVHKPLNKNLELNLEANYMIISAHFTTNPTLGLTKGMYAK